MDEQNQAAGTGDIPKGPLEVSDLAESLLMTEAPETDTAESETEVDAEASAATRADNALSPDNPEAETDANEEAKDEEQESDEGEEEEAEEPQDEEEQEPDESGEGDEETDGEEEDDSDASEVYFTTPDGDEVTLDELKSGYLRQSDYTKKTQQLAEMRKQGEAALQQVEQHNQVVAEHLSLALGVLEPQLAELANTDWEALAANDPYEYAEKRAQFDLGQQRLAQLRHAAQQTISEQNALNEKRRQAERVEEARLLQVAIPALADPKTAADYAHSLKQYAMQGVGLSEKEAGNIVDHRLLVVLDKARQFDELQSTTLTASRKKVRKTPKKVVKAGKPSSKSEIQAEVSAGKRAAVKNQGTTESLADWLLS